MKKLLSVALLLMLITLCFAFASCGNGVDSEEVNNNPLAAMDKAAENTASEFFDTGDKVYETIREALKKGSITLSFDENSKICEQLFYGLGDADVVIYLDTETGKYAVDLSVLYGEEKDEREVLKLAAYLDKNSVVVKDDGLLNLEESYVLNINDIINLPNTDLGEMLFGENEDAIDQFEEYQDLMNKIKAEYDKILVDTAIEENNVVNVFLKAFGGATTEEKVELAGESYSCVVANYTISKDNIEKAIKAVQKDLENKYNVDDLAGESYAELEEELDRYFEDLDEMNDFSATVKVYYDKSTGAIVSCVCNYKYTYTKTYWDYDKNGEYVMNEEDVERYIDITCVSTGNEISFTKTNTDEDGDKDITYSGIQKVRDGSVTTYTTVSYSKYDNKTTYGDSFVVSYDKSTGAIVAYDVDRKTGESEYKIYATATKDGDSVTITLDKFTENNYKEYEIGVSITFTAGVEVPVINGENNVAEMDDYEDFMDIAENFGESAFEDLFGGIF